EGARENVHGLVTEAIDAGAEVLTGGNKVEGEGYFYEPTVLSVQENSPILTQEIFGPVAPIVQFKDEAQAIRLANASEYGLAADRIDVRRVGLNAGVMSYAANPFGGVKHSGMRREGGAEGIEEYTSVQYIRMPNPYPVD